MPDLFQPLPDRLQRILVAATEEAVASGQRAYLVGGPVRDLLLGRPVADVDLMVEGEAGVLAGKLAGRLRASLQAFPQFLAFKLLTADGLAIDIATARAEHYRKPGALPAVTAAGITVDLARRDFSINAMAIDLVSESFRDDMNGREDLILKRIRVLHDGSFIDDPTRILRSLRLASRLGFTLDHRTGELLDSAVKKQALRTVSRERTWREVFLGFSEENSASFFEALASHAVLNTFLSLDVAPTLPAPGRLRKAFELWPDADQVVCSLAMLLPHPFEPGILEGSGLSLRRIKNLVSITETVARLGTSPGAADRSMTNLESATDELLVVVYARIPSLEAELSYLRELGAVRLDFSGDQLGLPAGPHIGRALRETRRALAQGRILKNEARAFARKIALQYLES